MEKKLIILTALTVVFTCYIIYMGIRNVWVFKQRTSLIEKDFSKYSKLCSYDQMMKKFWIWDIDSFIDKNKEDK